MSIPELIVIFIVALVVFGPEKLPEMARTLGKLMAEVKRNSDAIRREFYNSVYKPTEEGTSRINLATRELTSIRQELEDEFRNPLHSPSAVSHTPLSQTKDSEIKVSPSETPPTLTPETEKKVP